MTDEAHSGDLRNSQLFLDDRLIDDHVRYSECGTNRRSIPSR